MGGKDDDKAVKALIFRSAGVFSIVTFIQAPQRAAASTILAVPGASTVTNAGSTTINGDLGRSGRLSGRLDHRRGKQLYGDNA